MKKKPHPLRYISTPTPTLLTCLDNRPGDSKFADLMAHSSTETKHSGTKQRLIQTFTPNLSFGIISDCNFFSIFKIFRKLFYPAKMFSEYLENGKQFYSRK